MKLKTLSVKCPTCKKEVLMNNTSKHRPFCSARCRDIDFGSWASEDFSIEGDDLSSDTWSEDLKGS